MRGENIKGNDFHDAGAYWRCSYCGRYTDDYQVVNRDKACECGKKKGWCGSFKKPTKDSKWSNPMTDKILPDKDCKTIRDAITNPDTFKGDKHMDEVMREFDNIHDEGNEGWMPIASAKKRARKACRMYARKVVGNIWMKLDKALYKINLPPTTIGLIKSIIENEQSRLTDKEPT